MFMIMMSTLLLAMFMSLLLSLNPLTMGLMILSMSLIISVIYASIISSWYAFLIFLIYVGGMLVMFAYFMALIPNQSLKSLFNLFLMLSAFCSMFFLSWMTNLSTILPKISSNQIISLYLKPNSAILILLAMLLLFTMIVVVKISTSSKGPLRAFMSYV